ncbi:hypothetical protein ACFUTV_23405 [Streptomyces sp. NPDC057298]|uniref:hypothetical protein n=1 Tax=Streptomyces sp. NPDC057298 TaxID=3346091 RepID=UPI003636326E
MTLFGIVAITLAGLGVYIAYKNPKLGAAILVGTAILTVLWLITEKDPSSTPADQRQPVPTISSPVPWADPTQPSMGSELTSPGAAPPASASASS